VSLRVDFIEGAAIAVRSLSVHRLRTGLTTIGVGIGVATLLAMLGITQGLDSSFEKQLATFGSTSIYVARQPWVQLGNWWEFRNRRNVTLAQVEAVKAQCSTCATVVPLLSESEDLAFLGNELSQVEVLGTTADWPRVSSFEVVQGRFLSETDDDNRRLVAVIGADVADTLFPGVDPIGQTMRLGKKPVTVIGTLARKGKVLDSSQDLKVVIPFRTFTGLYSGRRSVTIGVAARTPDELGLVEDQLVGILRRVRQTPADKPDDFAINRPEQLASTYQQLTGALYAVALGIGFITMLVGGIGIMNIMLVSVRERTREIGVRRALGAKKRTIVVQFTLEATVVSALGGLIGTVVGLGGAKLLSLVSPLAATVKPGTVIFGIGFAALVGLLFGIWPAARAAALDPVEALRQE